MPKLLIAAVLCLLLSVPCAAGESSGSLGHQDLIKLVSQSKGKLVLVNFFASWCPPCKIEIPDLIKLRGQFGADKLVIIGVSVDQDPSAFENFVRKTPFNYPVYLALRDIGQAFQIRGIPKTLLYNQNGEQVFNEEGYVEPEDLLKVLRKQLGG